MFRRLACLAVPAVLLVSAVASAQSVKLVSSDTDSAKYRVEGAVGAGQDQAVNNGLEAALNFATGEVTGDPNEKMSAQTYVKKNIAQMKQFATPGQIFKRGFDASGEKAMLGLFVMVDLKGLKQHLIGNGVITANKELSKAVGKPKILVFYNQGDCQRGAEAAPVCVLPQRIREINADVEKAEGKINEVFEKAMKADCLRPTEFRQTTKDTEDESAVSAVSAQRTSVASVGMFHAAGASHTSVRAASAYRRSTTSETATEFIQASPNCKVFMDQARVMYNDMMKIVAKRNQMQDELDNARATLMDNDITTLRINEWLVGERWEIVDADAVKKAQRNLEAMTSTEGIPTDPIAATALMAGADVFVVHDFKETNPGGAYQVVLTVKAYDVVTAKLLASSVESSNKMFTAEKENAIAKAVGKAMPTVIEQVTGYWSDMAAEGVPTKVVFRGQFTSDMMDTIEEFLDEKLKDSIGKSKCAGSCEWNSEVTTKGTISGTYVLPAEARKSFLRKLRGALRDEGMDFEVVLSSPTLAIIEVM